MNIYALQTARGGSKSIKDKNITNVKGLPLYLHNVLNSQKCKSIKDVYVSTDIPFIKENAVYYNYKTIDRPDELSGDDASHHDTIIHGLNMIEDDIKEKVDILVVLLGNSIGAITSDLENAIQLITENPNCDSVQSVSEYNMYNPFRALRIVDGKLETIVSQDYIKEESKMKNVNDRRSAGNTYFFNGSFWIIRREAIVSYSGNLPFPWLGKNILPYRQDNFMEVDDHWQLSYLRYMEWKGFN
ncbi:cytidylyltransferase domain-containing protein [Alkalihalobacterium sp. APHAB7]|uniref:acylneuraminate cytidylyltransferase family protein n=1 Tax=Alkalihalobacterium sp. APHAB7 TaxID=3402081 RepID=UPI003AAB95BA